MLVNRILVTAVLWLFASHCLGQAQANLRPSLEQRWQEMRKEEIVAIQADLRQQGITPSKEGLRQYLRQITRSNPDPSVVQEWIVQLGSERFSEREAAEESLMNLPEIPIELLQEASQSSDREQAYRAKRILRNAIPKRKQTVAKAFRAIELLKLSGLTQEVIQTVRLLPDENLLASVEPVLLATVVAEDLPQLESLIDDNPALRTIAIHALSADGLAEVDGVRERLDALWDDGSPADRLAATESLLARGNRDALDRFVMLLQSNDVEVRIQALRRLWRATGKRLAFDPSGPSERRLEQIAAWRAWVDESGADAEIHFDLIRPTRMLGRTLVSSSLSDCVVEYDLAGNETWRVDLRDADECWGLGTGERVVCSWNAKALIVFAPGDGPPRELWRVASRCSARPLPHGNILVRSDKAISRYDRTGRKLWETNVVWNGKQRYPLGADSLPNGNIRVFFSAVFKAGPQYADTAVEIDERGQVVRELSYDPRVKLLERLPNGNALVRIDTADRKIGRRIEERDVAGKAVWSKTFKGCVRSAQRLPNGDTLVATNGEGFSTEIRAIRPDGAVDRKFTTPFISEQVYQY